MLKSADKRLSVYKGDYKPIELYKNNQKIHGFRVSGMTGVDKIFDGTYNAPLTIYGKSAYLQSSKNLCPAPSSKSGSYSDDTGNYDWQILAKENGYFDVSGTKIFGVKVTKTLLAAGTYTASGCNLIKLWWEDADEYLSLPVTFTLDKQTEVLGLMWLDSSENIFLENQYIQIEKSSIASTYVLCDGNSQFPPSPDNKMKLASAKGTITCNGAGGVDSKSSYSFEISELAGLQVASTNNYNYSETSSGKTYFYISDIISGTSIKRNIGKLVLNGQESFSQKTIQSTTHNCYYCDISHLIKRNRIADVCMCNCFETKNAVNISENGIVLGQNDTKLYFIVEKNAFANLNDFVQWISEQYTFNPVTVHYILDSEQIEPSNKPPLMSFAMQTRIKVKNVSRYPKLALSKCLVVQDYTI